MQDAQLTVVMENLLSEFAHECDELAGLYRNGKSLKRKTTTSYCEKTIGDVAGLPSQLLNISATQSWMRRSRLWSLMNCSVLMPPTTRSQEEINGYRMESQKRVSHRDKQATRIVGLPSNGPMMKHQKRNVNGDLVKYPFYHHLSVHS